MRFHSQFQIFFQAARKWEKTKKRVHLKCERIICLFFWLKAEKPPWKTKKMDVKKKNTAKQGDDKSFCTLWWVAVAEKAERLLFVFVESFVDDCKMHTEGPGEVTRGWNLVYHGWTSNVSRCRLCSRKCSVSLEPFESSTPNTFYEW